MAPTAHPRGMPRASHRLADRRVELTEGVAGAACADGALTRRAGGGRGGRAPRRPADPRSASADPLATVAAARAERLTATDARWHRRDMVTDRLPNARLNASRWQSVSTHPWVPGEQRRCGGPAPQGCLTRGHQELQQRPSLLAAGTVPYSVAARQPNDCPRYRRPAHVAVLWRVGGPPWQALDHALSGGGS